MVDLRERLDAIHGQIKSLDVGRGSSNTDPNHIGDAVLEKLELVRMEIKNQEGLPEDVVVEISKLREALDRLPSGEVAELRNVAKSRESTSEGLAPAPTVDLSEVHAKLDELIGGFESQPSKEPGAPNIEIPEVRSAFSCSVNPRP